MIHSPISSIHFYRLYNAYLLGLLFLSGLSSCQKTNDFVLRKKININGDILTCVNCDLFGHRIEIQGNTMAIAETQTLYLFEREAGIWRLIQEINYPNTSGIQDIMLMPSLLAIGVASLEGIGKVELHEKGSNALWSKFQELSAGKHEDRFGSAIQILRDRMIIGADAPYTETYENKDRGRAYIYRQSNKEWHVESELHSNSSQSDDRFGTAVCLIGDYALVNNITNEPIQVFKKDGNQWVFYQYLQTTDGRMIKGMAMASFENKLLVIPEFSPIDSVIALSLENNGEFIKGTIEMTGANQYLGSLGEAIEIYEGYALIAAEYENDCFLFRLEGNKWVFEHAYQDITTERVGLPGMAISDQFIAYGRNNTVNLFAR